MLCIVQSYFVKCKQEEFAVYKDFEVAFFEYCVSLLQSSLCQVFGPSQLCEEDKVKKEEVLCQRIRL